MQRHTTPSYEDEERSDRLSSVVTKKDIMSSTILIKSCQVLKEEKYHPFFF